MKEKILSITSDGFRLPEETYHGYDGFVIKTNKQEILIGISDGQSCCEQTGYLSSEDNFDDFIGAKVLSVSITNTELEKVNVPDYYDGAAMFVNVDTSNGLLQFVCYNIHNGYYGHDAIVKCSQLNHHEIL